MSDSSENPLTGPDLSEGVPLESLQDGTLLLGHTNGEAVVVARSGGELYAIGATCTHYGGPLGEGLLQGDTVICPWHHACFSLRTGEALSAPAFDPVPCFRVEQSDGKVFVRERLSEKRVRSSTNDVAVDVAGATSEAREKVRAIVIIGAGAAGVAAADMLRREGYDGTLHLLDALDSHPVDRPNLSKDYLAGSAPEEWTHLRPPEYYQQNNIELVLGTRIVRIDVAGRAVEAEGGRRFNFDRLLLATGATPVRLKVPGGDLPHVHYLRTLADSRSIVAAAKGIKDSKKDARDAKVVVIGASFIGLEVAAALRARNVEVHVVAPEERPLQRVLGVELGDMVRSLHESHGVIFHLKQGVAAIEEKQVRLESGEVLPADFVVVGVGVRPELALAEQAQISVDKGVLVDEYLQSSAPGIFAAGDIARWPDRRTGEPIRVEHWVVAERQGQTAARNMLGLRTPYTAVPFFWSRHYDLSVDYVGHAEKWDRVTVDGDPKAHDCTVTYYDGDRPLAVATVSREMASLKAEVQLQSS